MPRSTPSDRVTKLLEAVAAFVEHGFQRTQMDDVAHRLGVSKGTIYRAVTSKDALFATVIAGGDRRDGPFDSDSLETANVTAVVARVARELAEAVAGLEGDGISIPFPDHTADQNADRHRTRAAARRPSRHCLQDRRRHPAGMDGPGVYRVPTATQLDAVLTAAGYLDTEHLTMGPAGHDLHLVAVRTPDTGRQPS